MWQPGDHLSHRDNPELGPGRVVALVGRRLKVEFPARGTTLELAADSDALVPLKLEPGSRARLETGSEVVTIVSIEDGRAQLADDRVIAVRDLWPLPAPETLLERLARGRLDPEIDFRLRLAAARLLRLREAGGLGSFLGGRIHLFPHQLYAAERACASDPVRWLLADEVGLGKTVEACLIMSHLLHTRRAERVLVVAPATLTVQWLGELWRKYHQVFVWLDERRLADVRRDYGEDFNPFEVHPRAIIALELLAQDRRLAERAAEAAIDLLVVDEAHRLERPPGHPGNPAYRAIAPIAALGRHVLLLSATPLEDDAHGFFRLLQLLQPEALPEGTSAEALLAERRPLPPTTSSTRRADVGGLPPRRPVIIDLAEGWALAQTPTADDPRIRWLQEAVRGWRERGEKALVFVADREMLDPVRAALERRLRVGIFHKDLPAERRDLEVARFRAADGPAVLISDESGGEGRNFEFCHRLVLFDLPCNPTTVEQRIGRLDRIGRILPTEIVVFRPPAGIGRTLVAVYEAIGIFREPLGGLERELAQLARELETAALETATLETATFETDGDEIAPERFADVLAAARTAHDRVLEAAYHELHRFPYRPELAAGIRARIPAQLDQLTADVVLGAAARFGLHAEALRGVATWLIELGSDALVDHLPGLPPGARFLGSFDREEAVADESLDFFAFGHPLVEGVLAELEEGERGRVAVLQAVGEEEAFGLLALYRRGGELVAVAVDGRGRERPELAEGWLDGRLEPERIETVKWTGQPGWPVTIGKLARALPVGEEPRALAAFRLRPRGG